MNKKKQIREKFRNEVFARDNYTCRICNTYYGKEKANEYLDSHHILDRNSPEFKGNGGYVKENGISLCKYEKSEFFLGEPMKGQEEKSCHMKAEKFHITGGAEWEENMHPDDLYKLIGSSKEEAVKASERL